MFSPKIDAKQKQEIISLAGLRTANLFDEGGFCCSEAVLLMLNQGFGGGLPPEIVVSMGGGFCEGMGGAGCTCGSLSGAIIGLGMFLGPRLPEGVRKKEFNRLTKLMHDRFREKFRATCCRVLTKKVRHDKKAHFQNCKMLTVGSAEIVTEILLEARPDLAAKADIDFLSRRDSKAKGMAKKILGKI